MSISSDTLRKLSALRLDPDQMAGVLDILADIQSADEGRKAGQRERVRKHRESHNSNVSVTLHDRYTPPSPLSDKENPPAPPKEINSPPLPPAELIGAGDFESKILEAAGEMIHPHGAIVVGPILSLITAGADLELDVLPAIRATVARMARPARSWSYFVPAIQAAFDRRIAAGKWEPSTRAQPPPKLTAHQQRHKAAMNAFDRQLGIKPDDEPASNIIDLEGRDFRSL